MLTLLLLLLLAESSRKQMSWLDLEMRPQFHVRPCGCLRRAHCASLPADLRAAMLPSCAARTANGGAVTSVRAEAAQFIYIYSLSGSRALCLRPQTKRDKIRRAANELQTTIVAAAAAIAVSLGWLPGYKH